MKTAKKIAGVLAVLGASLLLSACTENEMKEANQELADFVDLERFMGTWYVHGYTPTFLDKDAYDATETYELSEDGAILTTYRFRKGSHEGKWKTMKPKGWVYNEETHSDWRMRFFGIFTAPYYILYVSPDYSETVIGHPGRDLAWVMGRSSEMSDGDYDRLLLELARRDYEMDKVVRVPHAN